MPLRDILTESSMSNCAVLPFSLKPRHRNTIPVDYTSVWALEQNKIQYVPSRFAAKEIISVSE